MIWSKKKKIEEQSRMTYQITKDRRDCYWFRCAVPEYPGDVSVSIPIPTREQLERILLFVKTHADIPKNETKSDLVYHVKEYLYGSVTLVPNDRVVLCVFLDTGRELPMAHFVLTKDDVVKAIKAQLEQEQ